MKPLHWILFALFVLVGLALQIFGNEKPGAHWWDRFPLFFGLYGIAGCVALVLVSKALGKAFVQQPEDYYERDE